MGKIKNYKVAYWILFGVLAGLVVLFIILGAIAASDYNGHRGEQPKWMNIGSGIAMLLTGGMFAIASMMINKPNHQAKLVNQLLIAFDVVYIFINILCPLLMIIAGATDGGSSYGLSVASIVIYSILGIGCVGLYLFITLKKTKTHIQI